MMANVTEDDLEKQRERVDQLREQLASEQAKTLEATSGSHNEVELAQLKAEEARLEADLANAKRASAAAKDAPKLPVAQAKERMEAEVARQKALAQADKEAAAKEKAEAAAEKQADQAGKDQ